MCSGAISYAIYLFSISIMIQCWNKIMSITMAHRSKVFAALHLHPAVLPLLLPSKSVCPVTKGCTRSDMLKVSITHHRSALGPGSFSARLNLDFQAHNSTTAINDHVWNFAAPCSLSRYRSRACDLPDRVEESAPFCFRATRVAIHGDPVPFLGQNVRGNGSACFAARRRGDNGCGCMDGMIRRPPGEARRGTVSQPQG